MTDLKVEAPQPSRQDLQETDPTQGHQAATQDLHHLCNKTDVTDTPDPLHQDHVATDLLLEDTDVAPPLPDTDLTHDLVLDLPVTLEVDQDLPDTTGHHRHTDIATRQGVRPRHLIHRGPGRDTGARILVINHRR